MVARAVTVKCYTILISCLVTLMISNANAAPQSMQHTCDSTSNAENFRKRDRVPEGVHGTNIRLCLESKERHLLSV